VADVLRRVEAVGAVVDVEDAVAVEEAARPCVAMAEDPEEHPNLDGGEVAPVGFHKRHRAIGVLEHPVDCTGTEGFLGPPSQPTSVGRVAEAEARKLGAEGSEVRCGGRAEAIP
jgi:hypothetical protein